MRAWVFNIKTGCVVKFGIADANATDDEGMSVPVRRAAFTWRLKDSVQLMEKAPKIIIAKKAL